MRVRKAQVLGNLEVPKLPPRVIRVIGDTRFLARDESKRLFKLIGGLGPTFILNTATDDRLGLGKWSVGPTLAVISRPEPWVVGAVVRNLWSFAGDTRRRKVNLFLVQPLLNYNFRNGWYLTSTPGIIANWKAEDKRNRWTVPIGGGVGKVMFRGWHPTGRYSSSLKSCFLIKPISRTNGYLASGCMEYLRRANHE